MKCLLDECVNRRLARDLPGHDVLTVQQMGWASIKNGKLLALADTAFDGFITIDRGIAFQQNVSAFRLAIFVLRPKTSRISDLRPLVPDLLAAMLAAEAGTVAIIE